MLSVLIARDERTYSNTVSDSTDEKRERNFELEFLSVAAPRRFRRVVRQLYSDLDGIGMRREPLCFGNEFTFGSLCSFRRGFFFEIVFGRSSRRLLDRRSGKGFSGSTDVWSLRETGRKGYRS